MHGEDHNGEAAPWPVVVVGGGAAGLTAALFAAEQGARTLLLERMPAPGKKILISGGGRCNALPSQADARDFVTGSSRNSIKKVLQAWPLPAVTRWFEETLGVPLKQEPETGKLFPVSDRAAEVRDALIASATRRGATVRTNATLSQLSPTAVGWALTLANGERLLARSVILATGGLSVPQTGSDGTGLRLATSLGHSMVPTYPALTPLTGADPNHLALAGISLTVSISAPLPEGGRPFATGGGFLFTHRGWSGPAALNISHLAVRSLDGLAPPDQRILVAWSPISADQWDRYLRGPEVGRLSPITALRQGPPGEGSSGSSPLPDRLAHMLIAQSGVGERKLAELSRDQRRRLVELLTAYPLPYQGHEGYKKAEVTGGGIPLSEIVLETMESRVAPGLFICGEMLDCFGPIGGYNFLWAWVTGKLAGQGAARRGAE